jgi:thymidine phosphorylase
MFTPGSQACPDHIKKAARSPTLDKLESIPGWHPDLDPAELLRLLDKVGGVITAAGDDMAPADRRLYALRDITATVESIPLIASSIMSKKVAEGTQSLLLDIKVGSGAFMTDVGQARLLGSTMIEIGRAHGVRTAAMLTAMDTPLGRAVGNAVEVAEALDVLGGGGAATPISRSRPARCSASCPHRATA